MPMIRCSDRDCVDVVAREQFLIVAREQFLIVVVDLALVFALWEPYIFRGPTESVPVQSAKKKKPEERKTRIRDLDRGSDQLVIRFRNGEYIALPILRSENRWSGSRDSIGFIEL